MGVAVWAAYSRVRLLVRWGGALAELGVVGFVVAIGALVYLLVAWILRVPELKVVLGSARRALSAASRGSGSVTGRRRG